MIYPTDIKIILHGSVGESTGDPTTLLTGPLVMKGISTSFYMDTSALNGPLQIELYDGDEEIIRICDFASYSQTEVNTFAYTFPLNGIRIGGVLGMAVRGDGTYTNVTALNTTVAYQQ